jgi:hypothetical protein
LYSSLNIIWAVKIKLKEIGRTYRTHRKIRNAYNILTGKTRGKIGLSAGRHRWVLENHIIMVWTRFTWLGIISNWNVIMRHGFPLKHGISRLIT